MKKFTGMILLACFSYMAAAQVYITRNGNISIYSHTPAEDIKAQNNEVAGIVNGGTGTVEFKLAVKSFHFPKTAMEEHFNGEKYMASEKYPKAGFKGKITDLKAVDFSKPGTYNVSVTGELTIRDVTKTITVPGTITVSTDAVAIATTFAVKRKEYNIMGESFVQNKLAESIQVTVNCTCSKQ